MATITGAGLGHSYTLYLAERDAKVVVNGLGSSSDGAGSDRKAVYTTNSIEAVHPQFR